MAATNSSPTISPRFVRSPPASLYSVSPQLVRGWQTGPTAQFSSASPPTRLGEVSRGTSYPSLLCKCWLFPAIFGRRNSSAARWPEAVVAGTRSLPPICSKLAESRELHLRIIVGGPVLLAAASRDPWPGLDTENGRNRVPRSRDGLFPTGLPDAVLELFGAERADDLVECIKAFLHDGWLEPSRIRPTNVEVKYAPYRQSASWR
jgi:hypothetical protein